MSETTCECGRTGAHTCNGLGEKGYQSIDPDSAEERVLRYAQLIHEACGCDGCPVHPEDVAGARAAIAVADEEQAALRAEVERLRKRTHEIADEQQRRFAPYVSRCERFDTLRKWAREHSGLVDPDGHIPDKAGSAWTYTSEAIRTLVVDALERAEAAEAEVERLTRECLDREATETDARERLRQVEATLTLDATHHVRRVWIERRGEVSWSCACGHVMKHQQMKDGYALIPMCPDDPRAAQAHAETFRD